MLSKNMFRMAAPLRQFSITSALKQQPAIYDEAQYKPNEIVSGAPKEMSTERVVRIFKEAKPATQSGHHNGKYWKLDWDVLGKGNRWENDLMGYQGSADYMQGTIMKF
ncbi:hypothetical protein OXX79_004839, partial [Metschnikowia pulcherrima]